MSLLREHSVVVKSTGFVVVLEFSFSNEQLCGLKKFYSLSSNFFTSNMGIIVYV